jgi:hypothetical protein
VRFVIAQKRARTGRRHCPDGGIYLMRRAFHLASLIERVRTGSVLAPLIALTLICGAAALSMSLSFPLHGSRGLMWCLWVLFGFCALAVLASYGSFAVYDPERLQTEDYRLARHRLEIIGDERDPNNEKMIEAPPTANTFLEAAR